MAGAAEHYRALVDMDPGDPGLRQKLGDALARSEQLEEARAVFVGLADVYSAEGHDSRAVAVLQRAVRLGEPDLHLLGKLADLLAALGRPADAKEALLQAVELSRASGRTGEVLARIEKLCALLPKDVDLRKAYVEVLAGPSPESALARLDLSLAHLRNEQIAQALHALQAAVNDDPVNLAALSAPADLVRLLARHGASCLESWAEVECEQQLWGWTVLRRVLGLAAREEDRSPFDPPAADGPESPLGVIRAVRCLLEAGEGREVGEVLLSVLRTAGDDEECRRVGLEALALYVSRNPDDQEAGMMMQDLSARPPSEAAPSTSASPVVADERGGKGGASPSTERETGPLPGPVRAASLEAQVLLDHGLFGQALSCLSALPARWKGHPEVLRLESEARMRADSASTHAARITAPTAAVDGRSDAASAEPAEKEDDELVVFMIDDDDVLDSARDLAAGEAAAEEEADTSETTDPLLEIVSPQSAPARPVESAAAQPDEDLADGHLDRLADELAAAMPEEDRETQYQMAIGLAEMGLAEQALPILEELAQVGGERKSDAVCRMASLYLELGREDEALEAARTLSEAGDADDLHVAAMLELLCGLHLARGDKEEAAKALARLSELEPKNAGIEKWKAQIGAANS